MGQMNVQKPLNDREVWDKAIAEAKKEPRAELTDDRPKNSGGVAGVSKAAHCSDCQYLP